MNDNVPSFQMHTTVTLSDTQRSLVVDSLKHLQDTCEECHQEEARHGIVTPPKDLALVESLKELVRVFGGVPNNS